MRTFLTLVCGDGSYQDLEELWSPIKEHFAGICAVCHTDPPDSMEGMWLERCKGAGYVTYLPYTGRHDLSRICALHCGAIQDSDLVVQTDTLERPSQVFCRDVGDLLSGDLNTLFFFGKILAYRYHESITFRGTPHEAFIRQDGQMRAADLAQGWGDNKIDEAAIRANVRPLKRPSDHWISHFARYMLLPWGSNHSLLGLDKNGDPNKLFPIREAKRLAFREEMRRRGFPVNLEGLRAMCSGPLDQKLVDMINGDKVWADWVQYHIFGNDKVICSHDDRDIIKVDSPSKVS